MSLTASQQNELKELENKHRATLEKMEEEHRVEIKNLEKQIEEKMKEFSIASRKLEHQKSKQNSELIVLTLRQNKEFEKIEKEFKDMKEKHLAEIAKKMKELELVKSEMDSGMSSIAAALKEEKMVRGLIALICEVDRLWLFVREEMEPLFMILESGETGKEQLLLFKMALEDMKARKKEMDEHLEALQKTPNLDSFCSDKGIYSILEKIGSPLKSLEALLRLAANGKVGDISDLKKEVDEVGKWVEKLRKLKFAPRKTVLSLMGETRKAIAS